MEEQTTAGAVEETSQQDTGSVAEESQTEVSESNVVSEEDTDVQESEAKPAEVKEPEGQKPQEEPKDEESEDVPFHERPGVKNRLEEIENKYGSKAQYWDAIAEVSQNDPEFRIAVLEKLEANGRLPEGTVEAEKKKLSSLKEEEDYVDKLPEDVKADLEAARALRQQQEAQRRAQLQQAETFFREFEDARPDIAKSPNPQRTRNIIFNLATEMVDRGESDFKSAMDKAYKTVMNPGASQNENVARQVQETQESAGVSPTGSAPKGKGLRKLTEQEKRAADLAGMSYEEYVKYADTPADELFENI